MSLQTWLVLLGVTIFLFLPSIIDRARSGRFRKGVVIPNAIVWAVLMWSWGGWDIVYRTWGICLPPAETITPEAEPGHEPIRTYCQIPPLLE
jgi:hypothetical protein